MPFWGCAVVHLAQELQTLRTMGIFQSNPVSNLITALSVLINPLLALACGGSRPGARVGAIVWYLLWSLMAAWVTYWIWHYHAPSKPPIGPTMWSARPLPWFLLFVMLLPQTGRLFSDRPRTEKAASPQPEEAPVEVSARPSQGDWPILARVVILLLIVACSTLVVDAADWIYRMIAEPELGSPGA